MSRDPSNSRTAALLDLLEETGQFEPDDGLLEVDDLMTQDEAIEWGVERGVWFNPGPRANPEAIREMAGAIEDQVTKYPEFKGRLEVTTVEERLRELKDNKLTQDQAQATIFGLVNKAKAWHTMALPGEDHPDHDLITINDKSFDINDWPEGGEAVGQNWLATKSLRGTLTHEMGHLMASMRGFVHTGELREITFAGQDIAAEKGQKINIGTRLEVPTDGLKDEDVLAPWWAANVSLYSATKPTEAWAEAWAAVHVDEGVVESETRAKLERMVAKVLENNRVRAKR